MKIRSWSRCWYEEFCSLGRITPTTVNGVSPRNTCCPTGASCSNSSLASSLPSTATRRRSATSRSLMKRPPASAMMLRIRPYAGTMPVTAGAAARTPRRTRALRVMNSGLMYSISWTSPARSGTSSGRSRIGAAVAEARERLGGAAAEQDHDPVAQPVKALYGLALQPDAERQQHHDRHGAPGDPDDGEGGAELLRPQVGEEFTPHVR